MNTPSGNDRSEQGQAGSNEIVGKDLPVDQSCQPAESVSEGARCSATRAEDSPAQFASNGVQRLLKKVDAVVVKTMLDPDAMRRVFARKSADQEVQLKELVQTHTTLPPAPCKNVERYRRATACDSSWERMSGGDKVRFCEGCQLQVYDFSDMDQVEAEELVFKREAKKDAVLYRRKDGRFLSADCPVGLKRVLTKKLAIIGAVLLIGAVIAFVSQLPPPKQPEPSSLTTEAESAHPSNAASSQRAAAGSTEPVAGQATPLGEGVASNDPVENYRQQRLKLQQEAERVYRQQSEQFQQEEEQQLNQQVGPGQVQPDVPVPADQAAPVQTQPVIPAQTEPAAPAQTQKAVPVQTQPAVTEQTQAVPVQSNSSPYVQQFSPGSPASQTTSSPAQP
jgi:hypothetical protein